MVKDKVALSMCLLHSIPNSFESMGPFSNFRAGHKRSEALVDEWRDFLPIHKIIVTAGIICYKTANA